MIKLNMYFLIFLLLLSAFYFVDKKKASVSLNKSLLIGLLTRLAITFIFLKSGSDDLTSFLDAGKLIIDRSPVYPTLYFPFFTYLGAIALLLKNLIHPLIFLKLIFTLFDLGNIYLIYLLSKKNLNVTLLYALNPITIICSNIHGQVDTGPIFFFLLAIFLLNKRRKAFSLLAISFAIFTKPWPALFITPIFKRLKNKLLFLLIIIFPLLSVIFHNWFFKTPIREILLPIKNYRGVYGYWGIGNILALIWPKIDGSILQFLRRMFLIALFIYSFYPINKNIVNNILKIMLFFFVFTLTFGSQWLAWLVPFIILVRPKKWVALFITATIYLIFAFAKNVYIFPTYTTLIFNNLETVSGFITWITTILIFKKYVQKKINKRGFLLP